MFWRLNNTFCVEQSLYQKLSFYNISLLEFPDILIEGASIRLIILIKIDLKAWKIVLQIEDKT